LFLEKCTLQNCGNLPSAICALSRMKIKCNSSKEHNSFILKTW
jgi:hypothetical protein